MDIAGILLGENGFGEVGNGKILACSRRKEMPASLCVDIDHLPDAYKLTGLSRHFFTSLFSRRAIYPQDSIMHDRFSRALRRAPLGLAVLMVITGASTANAAECPAKGARYISDNFVRVSRLTSLGGTMDPTLGCQWRRDEDGEVIWLNLGATMTPLNEPKPGANARPAAGARPAAAAPAFGAIAGGVYECDTPMNVGGMMMGTPATGAMFGVTGANTYRDFDGGRGSFALSGNILTMTSGPLRGTRYRRDGATFFRPLNAAGNIGPISCRLNKAKPLNGRW